MLGSRTASSTQSERDMLLQGDAEPEDQEAVARQPSRASASSAYLDTEIVRQVKDLVGDRYDATDVDALLDSIFRELERVVGADILHEDQVERVLAITVPRNLPCRLFCLSVLTLGLYYFIRPHDDVAVLVLQKSGHVLMVRESDRPGYSGELGFLVAVSLINILPPLFGGLYYLHRKELTEMYDQDIVHRVFKGTFTMLELSLFGMWVAFVLCLWTHRQRGYGSRAIKRFKCAYVSSAQFTLKDERNYVNYCCRRVHQRGSLRLFFGKYPVQEQLDTGINLLNRSVQVLDSITRGSVAASTEQSPAAVHDGAGQRSCCKRGSPVAAIGLFLLSVVFQLSVLYEYYEGAVQLAGSQSYCGAVNHAVANTGADPYLLCRPERCHNFFDSGLITFGRFKPETKWCRHVKWVNDTNYFCPVSRAHSCCSFCVTGAFYEILGGDDPKEWIKTLEGTLTNFLTIAAFFTSAAVISYLTKSTLTPQVELDFSHDLYYQPSEAVYSIKSELAMDFMHHMFAVDGAKEAVAGEEDRSSLILVPEEEAPTWQTFFLSGRRLTELKVPGLGFLRKFPPEKKVCLPENCLGIAKHEKVLTAWDERSSINSGDVLRASAAAIILAIIIAYLPRLVNVALPTNDVMDSALNAAETVQTTTVAPDPEVSGVGGAINGMTQLRRATGQVLFIFITALLILPLLLAVRMIQLMKVQCATIATSHRIFSLAYRPNFIWKCPLGWSLRIEVFRHDSCLFYGRMSTRPPPFLDRLFTRCTNDTWRPGEIVMQSIFGVLRIGRSRGDVREIYNMVATRLSADVTEKDGIDPKTSKVDVSKPYLFGVKDGSMTHVSLGEGNSKVQTVSWVSSQPHDPQPCKAVPIKGLEQKTDGGEADKQMEQLMFIWSFQEEPRFTMPYIRFNDIVITTDSIRLSSSTAYKRFDCKSCCFWGFPFHALRRLIIGTRHLPDMQSFLNFSHLQAFSTEYAAEPPLFSFRCPCFDVLCSSLTRMAQCHCLRGRGGQEASLTSVSVLQMNGDVFECQVIDQNESYIKVHYHDANLEDEWLARDSERVISEETLSDCLRLPMLAPARMSLFLLILQKYATEVQPDLVLCLRPCFLGSQIATHRTISLNNSEELSGSLERAVAGNSRNLGDDRNGLREVITLRALLNVVLESAKEENEHTMMQGQAAAA